MVEPKNGFMMLALIVGLIMWLEYVVVTASSFSYSDYKSWFLALAGVVVFGICFGILFALAVGVSHVVDIIGGERLGCSYILIPVFIAVFEIPLIVVAETALVFLKDYSISDLKGWGVAAAYAGYYNLIAFAIVFAYASFMGRRGEI